MEASAVSSFSSTPQADADAISLVRLSTQFECLLNPAFLNRSDAEIVLAGGVVGAYSCILAARSPVLHHHISSLPAGEKPRLELSKLVRGGHHIGREALHAVLGYMYTGVFKVPLQECADETCTHGVCRPAIDFVVQSTYAASGFQITELVSLCQRRLTDIVGTAYDEDIVPIIYVASTCQLSDLLSRCIQKVALSARDNYLEKQLPGDIYSKIEGFSDEIHRFIWGPCDEKTIRSIHAAMDSDDVDLVSMILKESALSLDDVFAIHYAAACCTPKMLAELLKLNSANVNLKNVSGYTPLHMACMRLEPGIILSLVEKGAYVLETAHDGRNALTICKRLAREKDFNRKLETCQERSSACLCIDILQKAAKEKCFTSDQSSVVDTIFTPFQVDNLHMRLSYLENRVNFAKVFFPSQATVAMGTAQDFTATREVSLNETPTMPNRELLKRLYVLRKTVELGRHYFPRCSDVIDKFLDEEATDLAFLDDREDERIKRRYCEIREEFQKALKEDIAAGAVIPPTSSSSARYERSDMIPDTSSSQVMCATDSVAAQQPFGLCSQAPETAGTGAGQLESHGSEVVEDNIFCAGPKTKLKSEVWNEIERVKVGDAWKGKCSRCKVLLSAISRNGTSHLRRHLKNCQPSKAAIGRGSLKL